MPIQSDNSPESQSSVPPPGGDAGDTVVSEAGDAEEAATVEDTPNAPSDWSVPTWVRHPRLEGILGARLAHITWEHLESVVARTVVEDLSIEYKQSHYVLDRGTGRAVLAKAETKDIDARIDKDRAELAKDVAAFANAAGGLIVVGIVERNGKAERFAEVDLSDHQRRTYLDTLRNWVTPYVPGVEIGHVPHTAGGGCVLIYVPSSADRPHAVGAPNSHRYTWYVRDGGRAETLSEAQVAVAYRDRFAGRGDIEDRVHTVFDQGVEELDRQGRVWLAAAVVPTTRAERRHLDRRLLTEFTDATHERQDQLPGARLGQQAMFGRGRVVLRDSPATLGLAGDSLLHLYAAAPRSPPSSWTRLRTPEPSGSGVPSWNRT